MPEGSQPSPSKLPPIRRRIILIKRWLQMKYVILVFVMVVVTALIVTLDVYYVVGKLMVREIGEARVGPLLKEASGLIGGTLAIYILLVVASSVFISHKLAGPVFRFERV